MYREKLQKYGQEHLFRFYDELSDEQRASLVEQIDATDFSIISEVEENIVGSKKSYAPLAALELSEIAEHSEQYIDRGIVAIQAGKIGAVLLAGGMGTRLGSDNPKGMYNIGVTKDLYIFECLINNLMDVVGQTDTWIHLFVMTSDKNHNVTVSFFAEHNYFGYKADYIHFFKQEMAPTTDYNGRVYLEEKWKLATSPNGNGGWFISLKKSGLLDLVHSAGIEWLNIFSVDNVIQPIADPCFIGAVLGQGCMVGAKVIRKVIPDENLGVMCLEDGKPSIVEYYELPDEMKEARDDKGDLVYNFGVILNYLFKVTELEYFSDRKLPFHKVEKKIPYIDDQGNKVNPSEVNGYKYENLVIDMIHQMNSCLAFEVERSKEFAPIKNKEGVDSVDTARELLRQNGVVI